jgi:very-short-patch-repair endonuclease
MKIINNRSNLLYRRRELRNNPTQEEFLLWSRLKNSQTGFKFRRQHSIGGYIVDFYCALKRVVVEIDGSQHSQKENLEYDRMRSKYFKGLNVKVLRFTNEEINNKMNEVIQNIINITVSTPPFGGGDRGGDFD